MQPEFMDDGGGRFSMLAGSSLKKSVRYGSLTVIDVKGKSHIFSGQNGPAVTIRLTDPSLHFRLFFNAQLALGEAYSDGSLILEEGSVYDFLDICLANQRTLDSTTLQKIFGIVRGFQSAF